MREKLANNFHEFRKNIMIVTGPLLYLCVILLGLATYFYPGGYNFLRHNISEVGRVTASNLEPNTLSMVLFASTTTINAFVMAITFVNLSLDIKEKKSSRILGLIGTVFGIMTAILYLLIGLVPADIHHDAHVAIIFMAAPFLCVTVLLFSLAIFLDKQFPNYFGYIFLIIFALFIVFAIAAIIGTQLDPDINHTIRTLGHVSFIFVSFAVFGTLNIIYWKFHRKKNTSEENIASEL